MNDHDLLMSAICAGRARWTPLLSDYKSGEVWIGNVAFITQTDDDGCPILSDACREKLMRAMNPNAEAKQAFPKGRW